MPEDIAKLAESMADHPVPIAVALLIAVACALMLASAHTEVMRRAFKKFFLLARNGIFAGFGWREFLYWIFTGGLIGVPVGLLKGSGKPNDPTFHWGAFFLVILLVACTNMVRAVFSALTEQGKILRPLHGVMWRSDRKLATAAVLKKLNEQIRGEPPTADVVKLITDILDVIVSHVRDHRGNHRNVEVFANLLLQDGDDLVVVARDANLSVETYRREVPRRYKKAALAAGRAISSGKPVSVGELTEEYPEAPKNKPYRSILALPLFSSANVAFGALSIDSSRAYFFESFIPGRLENDMENSLSPYTHTLVLALEHLLSRDPSVMLSKLLEASALRPKEEP